MITHALVGLFAGIFLGVWQQELIVWIVLAILFSVWPDFDTVIHFLILWMKKGSWRRGLKQASGKWAHEHRNILHIPLLLLPLSILLWMTWGVEVGATFLVLSLIHFALDSFGIGWGIRWLYPFTKRQWKYHEGEWRSWMPDELRITVEQEGDEHWLR